MTDDDSFFQCLEREEKRIATLRKENRELHQQLAEIERGPILDIVPYTSPRYKPTILDDIPAGQVRPNAILERIPFYIRPDVQLAHISANDILRERYGADAQAVVQSTLGRGSYGVVSQLCVVRNCTFALKQFFYSPNRPSLYIEAMLKEVRLHTHAAKLEGVAIGIYDAFVYEKNQACIVYEKAYSSLASSSAYGFDTTPGLMSKLNKDALTGLHKAMLSGLFHLDLSADNVFVVDDNDVWKALLGDWGLGLKRDNLTGQYERLDVRKAENSLHDYFSTNHDAPGKQMLNKTFEPIFREKGFDKLVWNFCLFVFAWRFMLDQGLKGQQVKELLNHAKEISRDFYVDFGKMTELAVKIFKINSDPKEVWARIFYILIAEDNYPETCLTPLSVHLRHPPNADFFHSDSL